MPAMTRALLLNRVRQNTRDLTGTIFRAQDVNDYINEAINRVKQVIPELHVMPLLFSDADTVRILPEQYHHLLAVYATSRAFGQDERHYQSTTYMNEFEVKLDELKQKIESGQIVLVGVDGNPIVSDNVNDYVQLPPYWNTRSSITPLADEVDED